MLATVNVVVKVKVHPAVKIVTVRGASIKYVRTEGEGGGGPKAYVVREVA